MKKAILSWSGGKDSALALFFCRQSAQYEIVGLLTNVNKEFGRVSMHGVRTELIEMQAEALGLPLYTLEFPGDVSIEIYHSLVAQRLTEFKNQGITHVIYGDIFLEDLRHYREQQLNAIGLQAVFPLWNQNTVVLLAKFVQSGFKAVLVCVNENYLPKTWVGRELDDTILNDLPASVDPCGENGEYHSFVYDGPLFTKPVAFQLGETVRRSYPKTGQWDTDFIFQDLISAKR
ncbi:Dph6-related ATP pyrophosphatase [Larkinella rosea]|uniref:Diphthine--ammonia ligase n=1 Tax=Larkinella rosea TaxID=2025312 RepID=A0A3P1C0I5_9BACT|nr:diphthine--ammonia ligase [Larkinella rosea]RRB06915.1 diphthine--ammonia ligase [Larkinella rosea]